MELAEEYDLYTDGYAARVQVNYAVADLDEDEDGFGFFFSEHGFQTVHTGAEQDQADADEAAGIVFDELAIQGWNGFAVHRVPTEAMFTFDNYHFEKDGLDDVTTDLYSKLPADYFTGSWYVTSFETSPDATMYTWNVDRYLPKWQYGDDEWTNDYRYSPDSPAITVKGYKRDVDAGNPTDIDWVTLSVLNIQGAMQGVACGLALVSSVAALAI